MDTCVPSATVEEGMVLNPSCDTHLQVDDASRRTRVQDKIKALGSTANLAFDNCQKITVNFQWCALLLPSIVRAFRVHSAGCGPGGSREDEKAGLKHQSHKG